jgi:hypothetical protein
VTTEGSSSTPLVTRARMSTSAQACAITVQGRRVASTLMAAFFVSVTPGSSRPRRLRCWATARPRTFKACFFGRRKRVSGYFSRKRVPEPCALNWTSVRRTHVRHSHSCACKPTTRSKAARAFSGSTDLRNKRCFLLQRAWTMASVIHRVARATAPTPPTDNVQSSSLRKEFLCTCLRAPRTHSATTRAGLTR